MAAFSYFAFADESFSEEAFDIASGGPGRPSFARAAFSVGAFSEEAFFFDEAQGGAAAAPAALTGGGYVRHFRRRARTRKDLEEERRRFGISLPAAQVIAYVAARQADALEADEQKRFEELSRELALERIEFEAKHLEALNSARQKLIDNEIALRLNAILAAQKNEKAIIALMLIAASV